MRLSRLVAVAAAVQGVEDVTVVRLRRQFHGAGPGDGTGPDDSGAEGAIDDTALEAGVLRIGPLEVATCDNDPERPENGTLSVEIGGVR